MHLMDIRLKQRLVGAAVLVVLGVIFLPMMLDNSGRLSDAGVETNIPPKPDNGFNSRVIPLGGEIEMPPPRPAITPPARPAEQPSAGPPALTDRGLPMAPVGVKKEERIDAWAVQIGSFSSEKNALALRDELRAKKYTAFVETSFDEGNQPVHRVRIGPELLRSEAQKLRDSLEQETKLKGIVISYP